MKYTYALLFFLFSLPICFAQPEIPGGDMETFEDWSDLLEADLNVTLEEPIYVHPDFPPIIRFFLFLFSDLLGDLVGAELVEFVTNGLGQAPYSPGAAGTETGLQLIPGAANNYADGGSVPFHCGERPYALSGYYRHVGSPMDTAIIILMLDNEPNYDAIFSLESLTEGLDFDGIGIAFQTIAGGADEYTSFEIPITYNNNEVPDSAILYLATFGDSLNIAQGNESYFVFDEIKFSNDPLNVKNFDQSNAVSVYPNPVTDVVNIVSDEFLISNIKVYDTNGKEVMVGKNAAQYQQRLDVSALPSGVYFLETQMTDYVARKKFVKE